MKQFKEGEEKDPTPELTPKKITSTTVMLIDFLTFNIGASRNQRTILIEMYNIVGDDPSTIWMGNVMVCT